jgi:hypothetical protein
MVTMTVSQRLLLPLALVQTTRLALALALRLSGPCRLLSG